MKKIADINWLYKKYYSDNSELRRTVMVHSECVAKKALDINKKLKLNLDPKDIYVAAMLHDIGVVKCNAPDINARGVLPYLLHGVEGEKMLVEEGLSNYASVCSRHTGAGITEKEIIEKNLPLPPKDYLPETLLEKLICYSDKFFSKSHDLKREKRLEEVQEQIKKFGDDSYARFMEMHNLFTSGLPSPDTSPHSDIP